MGRNAAGAKDLVSSFSKHKNRGWGWVVAALYFVRERQQDAWFDKSTRVEWSVKDVSSFQAFYLMA